MDKSTPTQQPRRGPRSRKPAGGASVQQRARIIEQLLSGGNYRKATEYLGTLVRDAECLRLPLDHPLRANVTAIAARLNFYRGDADSAYQVLSEYVTHQNLFLNMPGLQAGQKLVLAEYAYTQAEFGGAIGIAERIRADCEAKGTLAEIGEVYHFISRCHRRLHNYDELKKYCDLSRECVLQHFLNGGALLRASSRADSLQSLRWLIGSSSLVEGYSLWSRGDTTAAHHKLIAAKSLLEDTGDYIDEANVLQSLGSIARSEGDYEDSLECFHKALELYDESGHHLNKSRTLTNIARTYLRTAADRSGDLEKAREKLNEALEICDTHNQLRQKGEVLVIFSWLSLHQGELAKAEAYASEALKAGKAVDSPGLQAEAKISLGYCRYHRNDAGAIAELRAALQFAKTLKLQVSAHVALADVFAGNNNIYDAMQHLREAQKMLDSQSKISVYLSDKAEAVRKQIDALKGDYYLVTFDSIKEHARKKSGPKGLSRATKDLERWAIIKALEQSSGGMTRAAEMLGMARQAFWQRKKRARLT